MIISFTNRKTGHFKEYRKYMYISIKIGGIGMNCSMVVEKTKFRF